MIKKSLTPRKNNKLLRYLLFVVFVAAFVLSTVLVTRKKPVAEKPDALPAVVLQKPVNGTLVESVTISGYVEANAMIPVVPFVWFGERFYRNKKSELFKQINNLSMHLILKPAKL